MAKFSTSINVYIFENTTLEDGWTLRLKNCSFKINSYRNIKYHLISV